MIADWIDFWAENSFENLLHSIQNEIKQDRNSWSRFSESSQILLNSSFWNKIKDKRVNGHSVEKIGEILESNEYNKIPIRMANHFHEEVSKSTRYLPLTYLLSILNALKLKKFDYNNVSSILGRIYRSFASFIRDLDTKDKFELEIGILKDYSPIIYQDPNIDAKYHSDILIKLKKGKDEQKIYIWLYLYTQKSILNLIDRINGIRGKLPKGLHIFAPLNTRSTINFEAKLCKCIEKIKYINERIKNENAKAHPDSKELDKLGDDLLMLSKAYTNLDLHKNKMLTENNFVEIKKGWYLYSKNYCTFI